jgi:hypothetical protein
LVGRTIALGWDSLFSPWREASKIPILCSVSSVLLTSSSRLFPGGLVRRRQFNVIDYNDVPGSLRRLQLSQNAMDCRFACGTFTKRRPKSTVTARKNWRESEILSPADLQLNLAVQQRSGSNTGFVCGVPGRRRRAKL